MNQEKSLSITDIAQELNSGIATLKFILKRFSTWLPFEHIDGHPRYSRNVIPVLIKIQESLTAGMLPSEIDLELETGAPKSVSPITSGPTNPDAEKSDQPTDSDFILSSDQDIRVSKDGLSLIKSLFDDIAIQQNRVAAAHEKRAEAEERKAVAIEKRAEAEEKKAIAMNNIASALQAMNINRRIDSQEIAHTAAQVLALDETSQDMDLSDFDDTPLENIDSSEQQDDTEMFDSPDPSIDLLEASEIQMDDLSDLIQEDILLDQGPIPQEEPLPLEKSKPAVALDDLSQLIDEPLSEPVDVDNLSALIDTVSAQAPPETDLSPEQLPPLDDLALLIEDIASLAPSELDDLSLLIAVQSTEESQPPMALDDLSALIESDAAVQDSLPPADDSVGTPVDEALLDDLSALIEDAPLDPPLDDLSALVADIPVDAPLEEDDLSALVEDAPSLKPDITPQEDLKAYKAAVMKIILDLKTKNMSPEETTKRLNQDGVQTISGKSQWSQQAVSQIYKFIDSAR
jgi:hypothetical protein